MTVFVGQEMVNCPAPQKLDPKPQNRAKTVVFSMLMPKQNNKRSKNTAIRDTFATHNMSEMLYFTVFLDHLLKNTGIYSVLWKHMHETS